MSTKTRRQNQPGSGISPDELYDRFAPAVYGKIVSILGHPPVADKVLEKVFVAAFKDKDSFINALQPPLIHLVHQAQRKSEKTKRALELFRECCAGSSVSIEGSPRENAG